MAQLPIGTVAAGVDETSALVIVLAAAVAGVFVLAISPRLAIPVVVVELLLGIIIGPQGFDIASLDPTTSLLGDLGLGMLFFFAGYEIDFDRIKGRPLELGAVGWGLSLVLAYGIGGVLAAAGVILSYLYTGSAMATTAIGTLIPILSDAGEMRTRFGTYLLGAGGIGEFGPILLVTLILSTGHPLHEAAILVLFIALAVITGISPCARPGADGRWSRGPSRPPASSPSGSLSCSSSRSSPWRLSSASTCSLAGSWPA